MLAHEVAHAIQHRLAPSPGLGDLGVDAILALMALREGEAEVMSALSRPVARRAAALAALEDRTRQWIFGAAKGRFDVSSLRYGYGTIFALDLHRRGGVAALTKALRSPPHTTAEILHPELYPAPPPAEDPFDLPAPWVVAGVGHAGELGIDWVVGHQGVEGWHDDSYALLVDKGGQRIAIVWRSHWASGFDASHFAMSLRDAAKQLRPFTIIPSVVLSTDVAIEHSNKRVLMIRGLAPDDPEVARLLDAMREGAPRGSRVR